MRYYYLAKIERGIIIVKTDLSLSLKTFGFVNNCVYHNLTMPELVAHAVEREEGRFSSTGAFVVETGQYTGRSPKDRFIVDYPEIRNRIGWGDINKPISVEAFQRIFHKAVSYCNHEELFVSDLFAMADPRFRIGVRAINQEAWANLFIRTLLRRPKPGELEGYEPEITVICIPGFKCDPEIDETNSEAGIFLDLVDKIILVVGSRYAGEMKKSVFSLLNYFLPEQDVLPMHCSAVESAEGETVLFFGLSGTGKTTLSTNPKYRLIGDDEHGLCDVGTFNFEGGCYAKCINLREESEPQIYAAVNRFGAVLENVIIDENGVPDFADDSLTENTRGAFPIEYVSNASDTGLGNIPSMIFFLMADANGVFPPIAMLTENEAMYHFTSGYTSVGAGRVRGEKGVKSTFSACFGDPFLPLPISRYVTLLGDKLRKNPKTRVYLVNTGWSGGPYGVGERMSIAVSRAVVDAAIKGALDDVEWEKEPTFGLLIPKTCPGVDSELLDTRNTWEDKEEYRRVAEKLAQEFLANIQKFPGLPVEVVEAGPKVK